MPRQLEASLFWGCEDRIWKRKELWCMRGVGTARGLLQGCKYAGRPMDSHHRSTKVSQHISRCDPGANIRFERLFEVFEGVGVVVNSRGVVLLIPPSAPQKVLGVVTKKQGGCTKSSRNHHLATPAPPAQCYCALRCIAGVCCPTRCTNIFIPHCVHHRCR